MVIRFLLIILLFYLINRNIDHNYKKLKDSPLIGLNRNRDIFFTALLDLLVLTLAWYLFTSFRPGLIAQFQATSELPVYVTSFIHAIYWIVLFVVMGLYKKLYLISRFDELIKVSKAIFVGTLILYFIFTTNITDTSGSILSTTMIYLGFVGGLVITNRFIIRSIQRMYALKGKGLHRAIIIGTGKTALSTYKDLMRNRTLGMQVLGFIRIPNGEGPHDIEVPEADIFGDIDQIDSIIEEMSIQELIVALDPHKREDLVKVLGQVNHPDVSLKLLPDFHQLVSGLNKTNQIFGLPLIEISPDVMPFWEKVMKRLIDIVVSVVTLILFLPLFLLIYIVIKLDSEGPGLYSQKRVGKNGRNFTIYKFRTMQNDAENETGPTWAQEDDPRVTSVGKWLRKMRLDELPQILNVLKGEMSLVGPRPERPFFVEKFKKDIPMYSRRLRVKPGITGWAQVKWKYDSSLDDVMEKTKYDLFYVENMSLRMDFKILINTLFSIIRAKGR